MPAQPKANPILAFDPHGEIGWVGAAVGAGLNLGYQYFIQGKTLSCVNYAKVATAALVGAAGQGWLTVGKQWLSNRNAMQVLQSQLPGKSVSRAKKLAARIAQKQQSTNQAIAAQAYWSGVVSTALSLPVNGWQGTNPQQWNCGCDDGPNNFTTYIATPVANTITSYYNSVRSYLNQ